MTISQGRTVAVTDEHGEIHAQTGQSIFASDTRFVSSYQISINQQPWALVIPDHSPSLPHACS